MESHPLLAAIAAAPAGVALVGDDLRLLYVNGALAEMLGADAGRMLGTELWEWVGAEAADFVRRVMPQRFAGLPVERGGHVKTSRFDLIVDSFLSTVDGRPVIALLLSTPPALQGDERVLQRLAAAVSHKIGEDFFRALVVALSTTLGVDRVLVAEVEPGAAEAAPLAMAAGAHIVDCAPLALAGTPLGEVLASGLAWYPQQVRDAFPHAEPLLAVGTEAFVGVALRNSAGEAVGLLAILHGQRLPRRGHVLAALQIVAARAAAEIERLHRERERELLHESLSRSEKLSAVGALVAGVAHEVRNPLFGITATLDAFAAEFGAATGAGEYLAIVRADVDRLRHLMSDLLELARPLPPSFQTQPLQPLLAAACGDVRHRAAERAVAVRAAVEEPLPQAPLDGDRIRQALYNLVENAVEMCDEGGTVSVELRLEAGPPAQLAVSVSDDGPGFRSEDLLHVFEPFFTRRYGGTGLGLAIVRKIVDEHRGSVVAGNREDAKGGVVKVLLPVEAPRAAR